MNKIKLISLFIFCVSYSFVFATSPDIAIERMQRAKVEDYPHAVSCAPSFNHDEKSYRAAQKKIEKMARKILSKQEFTAFKMSLKGVSKDMTCVGQANVFLLANPPGQPEMRIPSSSKEKMKVTFFQTEEDAFVFYLQKKQAFENAPTQDRKRTRKELENARKFLYAFADIRHAQCGVKGLKPLDWVWIDREEKSAEELNATFRTTVLNLQAKEGCSDLRIHYNLTKRDGQRGGHEILIQLNYLRIYDGGMGVYQYNNLSDLLLDIGKLISTTPGCTYIDLQPLVPNLQE